jgi:hypothetical protein
VRRPLGKALANPLDQDKSGLTNLPFAEIRRSRAMASDAGWDGTAKAASTDRLPVDRGPAGTMAATAPWFRKVVRNIPNQSR